MRGRGTAVSFALAVFLALRGAPPGAQAPPPSLEAAAQLRVDGSWDEAAQVLKTMWEAAGDQADDRTALAFGQISLLRGNLPSAEAALRKAASSAGQLGPYGKLLLAQCLLKKGAPAEAEALLQSLASPGGPRALRAKVLWLLAQAQRDEGQRAMEVDTLRAYLLAGACGGREEAARFRLARALEAAGRPRQAFEAYWEIYRRRLGSPYLHESSLSAKRLAAADHFPLERLSRPEALAFAERLLHRGHTLDALELLEEYGSEPARGGVALDVACLRVACLYSLRQNARAVAETDTLLAASGPVPQVLPTCLKAGWCLVREQDHAGVLKRAQTVLDASPADKILRTEAYALMGTSAYVTGRFEEAEGYFRRALSEGGARDTRASAAYKRAWCLYALRDYAGAGAVFRSVAAAYPEEAYGPPSAYWAGRCALNAGEISSGIAELRVLAARPPGYWSAQARSFLEGRGESLPAARAAAPPPAAWGAGIKGPDAELARSLDLCGLAEEAALAFEPVYQRLRRDPSAAFTMALLDSRAGTGGKADWVLKRAFGPSPDSWGTPEPLLKALYPAPDLGYFKKVAAKEGVPVTLLMALILQESGFDSDSYSPAGAIGLMQLMPETAAKAAGELGLPAPGGDEILDPMLNVRLGTHYLAALIAQFPTPAAVASYNAGEDVVQAWLTAFGTKEMDQFAAMIPYHETRVYTARVLWHESVYRRLFGTR